MNINPYLDHTEQRKSDRCRHRGHSRHNENSTLQFSQYNFWFTKFFRKTDQLSISADHPDSKCLYFAEIQVLFCLETKL